MDPTTNMGSAGSPWERTIGEILLSRSERGAEAVVDLCENTGEESLPPMVEASVGTQEEDQTVARLERATIDLVS